MGAPIVRFAYVTVAGMTVAEHVSHCQSDGLRDGMAFGSLFVVGLCWLPGEHLAKMVCCRQGSRGY